MSNRNFAEPCPFRILGLNVTEDVALIARTFEEKKKANKAWEQSTRPDLRQRFKDLFRAGADLADPALRKALVQSHCSDFQKLVEAFCGAIPPGTPLSPDIRRKIEEQGVKDYHLAPELAVSVAGSVLHRLGYADGEGAQ